MLNSGIQVLKVVIPKISADSGTELLNSGIIHGLNCIMMGQSRCNSEGSKLVTQGTNKLYNSILVKH